MRMTVFIGRAPTYEIAAEKAQDEFINYCKVNSIRDYDIVSFSPTVMQDNYEYAVSLWLLLK